MSCGPANIGDRNVEQYGKYNLNADQITGSAFGDYARVHNIILQQYPALKDYIKDFSDLLAHNRQFIGREFIFAALAAFQARYPCGYVRIIADAGLGKTALATEIARRYNAPVFFANTREGLTRPDQCLNHLSADLIARFGLEHDHLPLRAGEDSTFFGQLLKEAAQKANAPLWVVVDALDEADDPRPGQNPLLLPDRLPKGVYVVLTHRSVEHSLVADSGTQIKDYRIRWNDAAQQADIEAYLRHQATERTEIARTLTNAIPPITVETFITRLKVASQGNFQYLAYVLADIADHEPGFDPLNLATLPQGLKGYYAQFWARMEAVKKEEGWTEWNRLYRPVIELLGVAGEPVTTQWLAEHTDRDSNEIRERALLRWQRFLSREQHNGEERWRIVHQSFADFLAEKVNLVAAHQRVANFYQSDSARWPAHNGYAHRHLSTHLRLAREPEDLFALVDNRAWYEAQMKTDPSGAAYITDLSQAWMVVEAVDAEEIAHGQVASQLGREARYTLAIASLHNLSDNIPPILLKALVMNSQWDLHHALAVMRQIPEVDAKVEVLSFLAPHTSKEQLYEMLRSARTSKNARLQVKMLTVLAPHLPKDRRLSIFRETFDAARMIEDKSLRVEMIGELAFRMAETGFRDEAYIVVQALESKHQQVMTLARLASHLTVSQLKDAYSAAQTIDDEFERIQALTQLAPYLPVDQLKEALDAAQAIEDEFWQICALAQLASHLPEEERLPVFQEILSMARAIKDDGFKQARVRALAALAPHLPDAIRLPVLLETFNAVRAIHDEFWRVPLLARLIPYLPEEGWRPVLQELLSAAQTASDLGTMILQPLVELAAWLAKAGFLDEALITAQTIDNSYWRNQALSRVALQLAKVGPLDKTLHTARSIDNTYIRAETLAQLAPDLPEAVRPPVLQEALRSARAIGDEMWQVQALIHLAPHLSLEVRLPILQEALTMARTIDIEEFRSEKMEELALHLAEVGSTSEARSAVRAIRNGLPRAQAFVRLIPQLPASARPLILQEALTTTRAIRSKYWRAQVLADLAPHLPETERLSVLWEALDAARVGRNEYGWAHTLAGLATYLSRDEYVLLLQEALDYARTNEEKYGRAMLLTELAPQLSKTERLLVLREALSTAQMIEDDFAQTRARVLAELGPRLAEAGAPGEALNAIQGIKNEAYKAHLLGELACHLPAHLLQEAVVSAQAVEGDHDRTSALVQLIPQLAKVGSRNEAIATARASENAVQRATILADLALCLAEEERSSLLHEALDSIRTIEDEQLRTETLIKLSPKLVHLPPAWLYTLWREISHMLAVGTRRRPLEQMKALSPVVVKLGGEQAATETAHAILEVGRWWP